MKVQILLIKSTVVPKQMAQTSYILKLVCKKRNVNIVNRNIGLHDNYSQCKQITFSLIQNSKLLLCKNKYINRPPDVRHSVSHYRQISQIFLFFLTLPCLLYILSQLGIASNSVSLTFQINKYVFQATRLSFNPNNPSVRQYSIYHFWFYCIRVFM